MSELGQAKIYSLEYYPFDTLSIEDGQILVVLIVNEMVGDV